MQCSCQELASIWCHIGWSGWIMKYVMPKTNVSSHSNPYRRVIITDWGSISQDRLNVNDVKEPQQNNSSVKPAHLNAFRALIDFPDDICVGNVWKMTATIADGITLWQGRMYLEKKNMHCINLSLNVLIIAQFISAVQ